MQVFLYLITVNYRMYVVPCLSNGHMKEIILFCTVKTDIHRLLDNYRIWLQILTAEALNIKVNYPRLLNPFEGNLFVKITYLEMI